MEEEAWHGADAAVVPLGTVVKKTCRRPASFHAELEALQRVFHESIVVLVGVCYESMSLFLPRFDCDLCALLLSAEVSSVNSSDVAISILKALSVCHSASLLHRDVKPENVLVMTTGGPWRYCLCDFGRCLFLCPGETEARDEFCGTCAYGAPEQRRGRYGRPGDLFSLAVLVFAVCHQFLPYEDDELASELQVTPPPEVDVRHGKLLRSLLSWEPERRFTAEQALAVLLSE
jgi:serine/threonine protein kinase